MTALRGPTVALQRRNDYDACTKRLLRRLSRGMIVGPGAWRAAASRLITCVSAAAASAGWGAEPPPPRAVLEKDFRVFLGWLDGEFDNNEQVAFADELGIPSDDVPERIHSIFKRVELPAFGEHVFYVEQYLDGDPAKIYRQRLYSFVLDDAEHAIKLLIHVPEDPAPLAGAHRDPSTLAGLTPAATRSPAGCEVYWHRRADAFIGDMKPGAWTFDRDIAVHDGGELVWTVTDARPAAVGLKIRRPVWPSGPNQDRPSCSLQR